VYQPVMSADTPHSQPAHPGDPMTHANSPSSTEWYLPCVQHVSWLNHSQQVYRTASGAQPPMVWLRVCWQCPLYWQPSWQQRPQVNWNQHQCGAAVNSHCWPLLLPWCWYLCTAIPS
jgi:hypothetical protein